jgi:hypothetical protein
MLTHRNGLCADHLHDLIAINSIGQRANGPHKTHLMRKHISCRLHLTQLRLNWERKITTKASVF